MPESWLLQYDAMCMLQTESCINILQGLSLHVLPIAYWSPDLIAKEERTTVYCSPDLVDACISARACLRSPACITRASCYLLLCACV